MKNKNIILVLVGLGILLALFVFKEKILYEIGTSLVIDQPSGKVDIAVATSITEKVIRCYQNRNCGKVLIVISNSGSTWKANAKIADADIREQAEKAGISADDLIVATFAQNGIQYFSALEKLFLEKNLRSAVFYVGYYKGLRHRFYLDRYLKSKGIETFVQPINPDTEYMRNFDHWWENTMLDNLFIDEYLQIVFYYFNRALLSSAV